ncbi:hypothetical protein [Desulfotruncus alcoholivorax]|uniref:hypothetical protein n=1 Tax=Desulfotruncus alcoholivorax TaxID=265477 RepID=UPI000420409B|nr:hypothetical protein [Desulfotruncus alcoholivorax]
MEHIPLFTGLKDNEAILKSTFGQNIDMVYRNFRLGVAEQVEAAVIYLDGITWH